MTTISDGALQSAIRKYNKQNPPELFKTFVITEGKTTPAEAAAIYAQARPQDIILNVVYTSTAQKEGTHGND